MATMTMLDVLLGCIAGIDSSVYKQTATHVRGVGISLADDPFERAAMMFADRHGLDAKAIIAAGYFDSDADGVQFRITRWSAIQ